MKNWIPVSLVIMLWSCNVKRIDTTEAVNQMKQTEVKRITAAQISTFANKWGSEITVKLNVPNLASTTIDSLTKQYKVSIDTINLEKGLPKNLLPKEEALYNAYKYNVEHSLPIESNLQNLENGEKILYTSPITFKKNSLWRIAFTKKEIIRKVNIKELKKIVVE